MTQKWWKKASVQAAAVAGAFTLAAALIAPHFLRSCRPDHTTLAAEDSSPSRNAVSASGTGAVAIGNVDTIKDSQIGGIVFNLGPPSADGSLHFPSPQPTTIDGEMRLVLDKYRQGDYTSARDLLTTRVLPRASGEELRDCWLFLGDIEMARASQLESDLWSALARGDSEVNNARENVISLCQAALQYYLDARKMDSEPISAGITHRLILGYAREAYLMSLMKGKRTTPDTFTSVLTVGPKNEALRLLLQTQVNTPHSLDLLGHAVRDQPPPEWMDWQIRGEAHYSCSSDGILTIDVANGGRALWRVVTLTSAHPSLHWKWRLDQLTLHGKPGNGVFPLQVVAAFDNGIAMHYTLSAVHDSGSVLIEPGEFERVGIEARYIIVDGRSFCSTRLSEWAEHKQDLFKDYAESVHATRAAPTRVLLIGIQALGQIDGCRSIASIANLTWE